MSSKTIRLHHVSAPAGETKFYGDEPTWVAGYEPADYTSELRAALAWHAVCASKSDMRKYVEAWIKTHRPKTATDDLKAWAKVPDRLIVGTYPSLARIHTQNFPISDNDKDRLWEHIADLMYREDEDVTVTTAPKAVVSVQDRVRAQVTPVFADIDGFVDELTDGEDLTPQDLLGKILTEGFKGPQLRLISEHVGKYIAEYETVLTARKSKDEEDEDLIEGYAHIRPRHLTKIINTLTSLRDGLKTETARASVSRIIRKKPVDKRKLAAKLRFKRTDETLGLTGIDPVEVIGATTAWYYNTKTRKLCVLIAPVAGGLHTRGPKIVGEDEANSVGKTLRKPEEQLEEFLGITKKAQVLTWFNAIRSKAAPINGRTTADMILVRVD